MRLYLDSANIVDWERLMPSQIFYGITTNPVLAQKAGWNYADSEFDIYFAQAARLGAKELHIQVYGEPETYLDFAEEIYTLGDTFDIDAVIKVPLSQESIAHVASIKELGGKVLMTACYEPAQVLIAEALGADYVAPYLGRISDLGEDASSYSNLMQRCLEGKHCQLMAASIRSTHMLTELASIGVPNATISSQLADTLLQNEHTTKAVRDFNLAAFNKD